MRLPADGDGNAIDTGGAVGVSLAPALRDKELGADARSGRSC